MKMKEVWVHMSRNELELSAGMSATQVKNLRSQVGRAAVHVMAALFEQVLLIANIIIALNAIIAIIIGINLTN